MFGACTAPATTSSDSIRAIVRPVIMRRTEDGHSTGRRGRRVGGRLASHPSLSRSEEPRHPKDTPAQPLGSTTRCQSFLFSSAFVYLLATPARRSLLGLGAYAKR